MCVIVLYCIVLYLFKRILQKKCSAKISKHTTLFRSLISATRRLTWLQKMLREIGESPAGSASIFRKWKEQTAWSLVEVNAERLICPNQDFSTWFVTIFACQLTCSRHGNGIRKSAIWQVSLAVRKREIYHRNRYPIVFHLSPT